MSPSVGIVADDLTGAADTGVAFLASGLSGVVSWPGQVFERVWLPLAADVFAVTTGSRAADAEYARDMTKEVVSTLRQAGVATLYKKIDSMLRGHIGDEVRAAVDAWHPGSLAVVAPAFPAVGRTTVNGRQCVDGLPLATRAFVQELFEHAGISTCRADLACVRSAALESTLLRYQHRRTTAVVCDAETDEDLRAIARAGAHLGPAIVWVGSGGLARAMAANIGTGGRRILQSATRVSGPMLIVVGSTSEAARVQADDVAAAGARRVIAPVAALVGESVMEAGSDFARDVEAHLRAGDDVLVTLGPGDDAGCRRADDSHLTARLGDRLRPCASTAGCLLLTGGDTADGVLQAWGVAGLRLVKEIEPGVVLSETVGARAIPVVTKAGSFGDRGTLTRVRKKLRKKE